MQAKIVPAQIVLAKKVQASFSEIGTAVGNWPTLLWGEVARCSLPVAGSLVYSYVRGKSSADKNVQLLIGIPVADYAGYHGEFEIVDLPEFLCLETLYKGSVLEIGSEGWAPFMQAALESRFTLSPESREVYRKWVGPASPDNEILLQLGVLPA